MKKLLLAILAVALIVSVASFSEAGTVGPYRYARHDFNEGDTIGRAAMDSDAITVRTIGKTPIVSWIEIDGYSKSSADFEIVVFWLEAGDVSTLGSDSVTVYGAKTNVIARWPVAAYGGTASVDTYAQVVSFKQDFSNLPWSGIVADASSSIVFGVQAEGGDFYSSAAGATDFEGEIRMYWRFKEDEQIKK